MNASGDIIANTYDYIGFYLSGTDLYRAIDANVASARVSGTKKVALLVNSLAFTYDNADLTKTTSVSVDLVTQITAKQGTITTHLHEKFYLRNI